MPTLVVLAGFLVSNLFLSWSVMGLPLIVVYALLTGLGGAAVAVLAAVSMANTRLSRIAAGSP